MKLKVNIWESDRGFVWMLAIALLSLMTSQLSEGIVWESKFMVRAGFFLFTYIAVRSSSLTQAGKSIGYTIATALLIFAITMIWSSSQWLLLLYTVLTTGYMVYIITLVVSQIFASGVITVYKVMGGVAAYILLAHLWATVYLTIYIIEPASFNYGGGLIQGNEALKQLSYFSIVTLTTIGYGDITAVSSVARVFVMMEGLLGQLVPAIFIAKLVSLQIEHSRKR